MLTYITTYCDNPEFLEQALDVMQECTDERLKMIIVDDCSDVSPKELIAARSDSRISLYRITEDLGFNSHGGRNLAMRETTTEWNLLVDVDFQVVNIQSILDQIVEDELESDVVHFIPVSYAYQGDHSKMPTRASINDFLITKTTFWNAGGYDPEFFGWHHGDRSLLHRIIGGDKNSNSVLFGPMLNALRSPFAKTRIDPELKGNQERYSEDRATFYVSPESQVTLKHLEAQCIDRHSKGIKLEPVPFAWEQLI